MQKVESLDRADPFSIEGQLDADERAMRETAHANARERRLPRIKQACLDSRFDREIMNEMGALGLPGSAVSPGFGGRGRGYVGYGPILGRAITGIAAF